jgi:hypothetical protein
MDSSDKDVADQKVAIYEGIQPSYPYTPKECQQETPHLVVDRKDLILIMKTSKALPVAKHDPPSDIHDSQ